MIRIAVANSFFARLRGLLGTQDDWGYGKTALLIPHCRSVHTFGMRYALDIAFVDRQGAVIRSERNVAPGRLLNCKKAVLVLERPHDATASWLLPSEKLALRVFASIEN